MIIIKCLFWVINVAYKNQSARLVIYILWNYIIIIMCILSSEIFIFKYVKQSYIKTQGNKYYLT